MKMRLLGLVRAYPVWVMERAQAIVVYAALLAVAGVALATTLPLHTEFSWLLPDQQPSVRALRQLTARKPSVAVIEIGIASPSMEATRRFATDLAQRLRKDVPPDLLREVDEDDGAMRRFIWDHRHLYAKLDDLRRARDELSRRVEKEKEKRNPLLVNLLDDEPAQKSVPGAAKPNPATHDATSDTIINTPNPTTNDPMDDLKARLDEARAISERPPGYIGEDGRLRMLVVRCPFGDTEPRKGQEALAAIGKGVASLYPAGYHPDLVVGYAGDPVTASLEHDLILRDVAISTVLCLTLVMGLLLLALRAPLAVFALCASLLVGCAATFGFTRLWVGQLNSSTAFLGSVVAGNGINFGVILLSRYLEERRRGVVHSAALRTALQLTALPTLVAAAAAGTAYFSLIITSFRGFSEFGIIAGSGMVFCWASSYLVLPALLTLLEHRRPLVRCIASSSHRRLHIHRPRLLQGLAFLVVMVTFALGIYGGVKLTRDPFEDDLRSLRSRSLPKSAPGQWSRRLDAAFGKDLSGGFYLGTDRVEDVKMVLSAIEEAQKDVPPKQRILGKIDALPNVLPGTPDEQRGKIALLQDIRALVEKVEPYAADGSDEARFLEELKPPPAAVLHPVGAADLPERIRLAFTESNGAVGRLLAIHPGPAFQNWSYRGNKQAVELLRALRLPDEIRRTLQVSGAEVIFVDMMEAVQRDGPLASAISLLLVLLLLLVSFGPGRDFLITSYALFVGAFGMLGLMGLLHVRLNFLNYIAVPITIGIGVDYPFNVMARLRQEVAENGHLGMGLLSTGTAVVLCSLTTMIGYAVLLLSDTGAIRSFGMAAVLGELTSITAAIVIVPCLIVAFGRLQQRRGRANRDTGILS